MRCLYNTSTEFFISVTAGISILLIISVRKMNQILRRCRNTYALEKPPFILPGCVLAFIALSAILIGFFQVKNVPQMSLQFSLYFLLNMGLIIIWFLISYLVPKLESKPRTTGTFMFSLLDEPIQHETEDLLGRNEFIEHFYDEIIKYPYKDSCVFGLHGSWGEGKTSAINLLMDKLEQDNRFLVVNFDPWFYKDEEAILVAFYKHIEYTLSREYIIHHLKKTFLKYLKLILSGFPHVGINLDFLHIEESQEETKGKIEHFLEIIGRKIVIFIDNIDRLQPEEILLIFKLVRLNTKFKNTIFVLVFDENYVFDMLKGKWASRSSATIPRTIT